MSAEPIRTIPPDWKRHDDVMVVQGAWPWTNKPEIMEPIWKAGIDGRGCICIDLDTGYKKHKQLPEPIAVKNFTGGNVGDVTDRHGHGNHTIGSAVGRDGFGGAPGADLKVGKCLGDNGSGSNTIAALNWAAEQDGDVVTCSWGSSGPLDAASNAACKRVEESGKWLVFAAGNAGYNGRGSTVGNPAQSIHCGAVSSINSDGSFSGFTSGGPEIDFAAGGGNIISAGLNNDSRIMSGTSMACPTKASRLLLLRHTFKLLGMRTNITMFELITFMKSEAFLRDIGAPGRDNLAGDGVFRDDFILEWITSKIKNLVIALALMFCIVASAQAQILENPAPPIPQKQVAFLRAQSVQLIEDAGKILILAEGLEAEKQFAVVLAVGNNVTWAEIHDETKPFPPRIQVPDKSGNVIVVGKPNQAFYVSVRSATEPPIWTRVVVAPNATQPPPVDPPPTGDFRSITELSKAKAALLDKETANNIRNAVSSVLNSIDARCQAGQCPTFEQARKEVIDSFNLTPKNQRFDWYKGWREPVSVAVLAAGVRDPKAYVAAMRAALSGLE